MGPDAPVELIQVGKNFLQQALVSFYARPAGLEQFRGGRLTDQDGGQVGSLDVQGRSSRLNGGLGLYRLLITGKSITRAWTRPGISTLAPAGQPRY